MSTNTTPDTYENLEETRSNLMNQMRRAYHAEVRKDAKALAREIREQNMSRDDIQQRLDEDSSADSGDRQVIITWQALCTLLASDNWLEAEEQTGYGPHELTAPHPRGADNNNMAALVSIYASAAYRADLAAALEDEGIDLDARYQDDDDDEPSDT